MSDADKQVLLTEGALKTLIEAAVRDQMLKSGPVQDSSTSGNVFSRVEDLAGEPMKQLKKASKAGFSDADMDSARDLVHEIWRRDGWMNKETAQSREAKDQITYRGLFKTLKDTITSEKLRILIPTVMSDMIREPMEPNLIGTNLAIKMNVPEGVEQFAFPAVHALRAWDVAEGDVYKEQDLVFAGKSVAMIGKSGLKLSFTEEALNRVSLDVMGIALRASRRALDRLKEDKIWKLAIANAQVVFDNAGAPATTPTEGTTTGRDSAGNFNGTFLVNDLFVMFANAVNAGYLPDTLITNPHGWFAMARDPIFRAFGFQNGGALFQTLNGAPGTRPTLWGGANLGPEKGQSGSANNPTASTWAPVPFYPQPLKYLVSPFIAWDSTNLTTSLLLIDSSSFVGLAQQEEPKAMAWEEPDRDVRSNKIREKYATFVVDEGKGMYLAKNVKTNVRGYDIEDKLTWQAGSGVLPTGTTEIGL